MLDPADGANSRRMIGRVGERRATSTKPAARKAAGSPVQAKASGNRGVFGTTG